jgi:hypothetical protein
MKLDQMEFMSRTLQVAISQPPAHDKLPTPQTSMMNNHSTNIPHSKMLPRTEQKSRISFIPASVSKASTTKDVNMPSPTSTTTTTSSAKSNDDFRKMFAK